MSTSNDMWADDALANDTPMRDFYRNKTIFLTGATGFLGQILVEKLLRCEAKVIYVLARNKRGTSAKERLREMYSGALFSVLLKEDANYMDLVRVIEGDTREMNVGISINDQIELIENVEIVLHAAADVRFDNTLKELSLINLRGTREMLKIAERMKRLIMFAYISTAFSNCPNRFIEEKFYPAAIEPETMIRIAEKMTDDDSMEIVTDKFVAPWPNTYSFTKALSEALMRDYGNRIPIVVVRPSISMTELS